MKLTWHVFKVKHAKLAETIAEKRNQVHMCKMQLIVDRLPFILHKQDFLLPDISAKRKKL
uniref:Uncharacterized protein n=1 Tax=Rhizophora mucronata TaxID=61149 RepID=A0A2P2Q6F2_RHIMU